MEQQFGPIDVWINNAMTSVFSPVKDMTSAEFKRVTEVTYLGLFSNLPLTGEGGALSHRFELQPGKPAYLVIDYAETRQPPDVARVRRWLEVTQAFWREWNLFNYYRGPHQDIIRRGAITLKLLTYAPTGAIVAAPTTSLPEEIGGGRGQGVTACFVSCQSGSKIEPTRESQFRLIATSLGLTRTADQLSKHAVPHWTAREE